MEIEPKP